MVKLIIKWILFAFVIMGTCYLPGIKVDGFQYAMFIAMVLTIIKPVLKLVTFPINMLTFGLFGLVINFGILYAVGYFIKGYHMGNLGSVFIASIIIAVSYCVIKKL